MILRQSTRDPGCLAARLSAAAPIEAARRSRAAERKALAATHKASAERWALAQQDAERTLHGLPPAYDEPPAATIAAARFLVGQGDVARFRRFLDGRAEAEVAAIIRKVQS